MWVYTPKEPLERRLAIDPFVGLWLDQWLSMLAEDTHPYWAARPLGLASLAELVNGYQDPEFDQLMIKQTAREAEKLLPNIALPSEFNQPVSPYLNLFPQKKQRQKLYEWATEWKNWFQTLTSSPLLRTQVVDILYERLISSIESGDPKAILMWTRLLGQELLGQGRSPRGLLEMTLPRFVPREGPSSSSGLDWEALIAEIVKPVEEREFQVQVFATSGVIGRRRQRALPSNVSFSPDGRLESIVHIVRAVHREDAKLKGLSDAMRLVQILRTRHSVNVQIHGNVRLSSTEPGSLPVDMPPPQPFWERGPGKRAIPTVPAHFDQVGNALKDRDATRWRNSRSQFDRAVDTWAEDIYAAATYVWAALEALSGRTERVAAPFQRSLGSDLLDYMAAKFSLQCDALQRYLLLCAGRSPWSFYEAQHWSKTSDWLTAVLTPSTNQWYYENWREPKPPPFLFDRDYGKFYELQSILSLTLPLYKALSDDLKLLRALRNGFIHNGNRTMSYNLASYLGRVGLEVLLKAMNVIAEHARSSAPGSVSIEEGLSPL